MDFIQETTRECRYQVYYLINCINDATYQELLFRLKVGFKILKIMDEGFSTLDNKHISHLRYLNGDVLIEGL